jgi:hypothetical protein
MRFAWLDKATWSLLTVIGGCLQIDGETLAVAVNPVRIVNDGSVVRMAC